MRDGRGRQTSSSIPLKTRSCVREVEWRGSGPVPLVMVTGGGETWSVFEKTAMGGEDGWDCLVTGDPVRALQS